MASYSKLLIKKFFEENSLVESDIGSFNHFLEKELQRIIEENKIVEPTIIPPNVDSYKIRLDRIFVEKPEIIEADGSRRPIYPIEARLRKITYSAPIYLELSSHINEVQRESITAQIGNLPIMLKSKHCHLDKLSRDELIEKGEDPEDPGGYFIINGTERVIVTVEDLVGDHLMIDKQSRSKGGGFQGKIFSNYGAYKIPHTLERRKDGLFYLTFTRVRRVPIILVIKALGLIKDEEIMNAVSKDRQFDEVLINLFEFVDVKDSEEAMDKLAKEIGITQTKEIRLERMSDLLDRFLLPHLGDNESARVKKAHNLCKLLKKYIRVDRGEVKEDDKDHYMNKRLKMSGELLADLFRVNLSKLIGDMLYNFQRIVKKGKHPGLKMLVREKLLTNRIYGAMATGNWVGSRTGISQRIQRINHLDMLSHLQRVVSPLSSSQQNFAARELHATHLGRLCPLETPEGGNIGLRKNISLMAKLSMEADDEEILNVLKNAGLKV